MNPLLNLTPQQLRQAADIQERIEALQGELAGILGSPLVSAAQAGPPGAPRKRKISAAGLERIRAAQKARWAKVKALKASQESRAKGRKSKGRLSAAAKARISERMREVWAARRAARS